MKHLTNFKTIADFNAKMSNLNKPNVSFVAENGKTYVLADEAEAEILMFSMTGYQLYGEYMGDGQITYFTFEYVGTKEYEGKEYYEYSFMGAMSILAPTRNVTKVTFPFDNYYIVQEEVIMPLSYMGIDSLYGFTSVPENKVVIEHRTDIGTNANGHSYVDLGLTSGTLWATMNAGAESATEYGGYYQWGDTVDKSDAVCDWETYKYSNDDGTEFSKYNTGLNDIGGTIDNKITLDLEDDAARANMGGDWKMPSLAQMDELVQETNNVWVEDYEGSGVNGRLFTSKTNGNSIFIPASGYRFGSSFYDQQGSYGNVWASSLDASGPDCAMNLSFSSYYVNAGYGDDRSDGFVVRGIL